MFFILRCRCLINSFIFVSTLTEKFLAGFHGLNILRMGKLRSYESAFSSISLQLLFGFITLKACKRHKGTSTCICHNYHRMKFYYFSSWQFANQFFIFSIFQTSERVLGNSWAEGDSFQKYPAINNRQNCSPVILHIVSFMSVLFPICPFWASNGILYH